MSQPITEKQLAYATDLMSRAMGRPCTPEELNMLRNLNRREASREIDSLRHRVARPGGTCDVCGRYSRTTHSTHDMSGIPCRVCRSCDDGCVSVA